MNIINTPLKSALVINPKQYKDDRGYFMESFRESILSDYLQQPIHFIQDNESYSTYGVLRGLHFQTGTATQSKLVRVVSGAILDVIVDLRVDSSQFGQSFSIKLSADNQKQLFVPKGFAHGFITLSREAIVQYKVDAYYSAENDAGIHYADSDLGINWILQKSEIKLSDKDKTHPTLKQYKTQLCEKELF